MATVFLALGSNVGDMRGNIAQAIELLGSRVSDIKTAPIYTTKPVGYKLQPDFLNTAIEGETELSPLELLRFVKDIEQQIGRIYRFDNGPREIDIDISFYGNTTMKTAELSIPHASATERDFVLRPICDLDPNFIDPKSGKTVQELLEELPPSELSIQQ